MWGAVRRYVLRWGGAPVSADLKASARRVQAAIAAQGFAFEVRQFPEGTRTSAQAAAAVGECERFYPALQMVIWGGRSVEEAVQAALMETLGEA